MKTKTIVLRGGDNWNVEVPLDLGLKIPSIRDKLNQDKEAGKLKKTYKIKGITRDAFGWVLDYLNDNMGHQSIRITDWPHLLAQLPLVSLFNLIQAAYFLNIESLMDLTCRTMASKLKELKITSTLSDIYKLFNIHNPGCLSVKTAKRDVYTSPCSRDSDFKSIIRNRTKGAFINDLNIPGMQFSIPLSKELGPVDTYSKRWQSPFYECVEEINKSMNFSQWVKAIHKLEGLVKQDFRLAACLSGKFTLGLLQILERSKNYRDLENDVQRPIISIISHARFTTCNDDVVENHVVPALVKIASDGNIEVSDTAMLALTRLAYVFPNHYKVFVNKGALDAAQRVFRDFCDARDTNMSSLAMFLAAVCRGYSVAHPSDDLPSDKVEKILPILEDLLRETEHCYDKTRIFACYALSYLTYGMFAPLSTVTFSKLFAIFSNDNFSLSLAGPALGVVGNVVRWGNLDQIKFLLGCGLLESLEQVLCLKYKKFLKEACQIISNVAARHGTLIKELIAADLIEHLCFFLEDEVSDVKLEAAWAIFYSIRGLAEHGEIDQYPETVVNRYILRERDRDRERDREKGMTTVLQADEYSILEDI